MTQTVAGIIENFASFLISTGKLYQIFSFVIKLFSAQAKIMSCDFKTFEKHVQQL